MRPTAVITTTRNQHVCTPHLARSSCMQKITLMNLTPSVQVHIVLWLVQCCTSAMTVLISSLQPRLWHQRCRALQLTHGLCLDVLLDIWNQQKDMQWRCTILDLEWVCLVVLVMVHQKVTNFFWSLSVMQIGMLSVLQQVFTTLVVTWFTVLREIRKQYPFLLLNQSGMQQFQQPSMLFIFVIFCSFFWWTRATSSSCRQHRRYCHFNKTWYSKVETHWREATLASDEGGQPSA